MSAAAGDPIDRQLFLQIDAQALFDPAESVAAKTLRQRLDEIEQEIAPLDAHIADCALDQRT